MIKTACELIKIYWTINALNPANMYKYTNPNMTILINCKYKQAIITTVIQSQRTVFIQSGMA